MQITEDGSPNNLTLSPTTATIGPSATDGKLTVTIGASCPWVAFSNVSWLQITSANSGFGNFTLTYHAAANPSSPRTGTIQVGPQTFTVTQQAVPPPPITLAAVTNAASGIQGGVSPGEIVSLFGSNMGPAVGVPLQLTSDGKSITKTLSGVQVLFDGNPAALTYASAGQINAVVPYAVAGEFNTQVQVQYQGASSNSVQLAIQNASPGIFTLDSSGSGAGAILNQDSTVNSPSNPAGKGSIIVMFATGAGQTDPAGIDGQIAGDTLPKPLLGVSAQIAGLDAKVLYAGAAPGMVAGVLQVNCLVPLDSPSGYAVPIVLSVGKTSSPAGVTVAITTPEQIVQ
jgi:uncharacterized protein (TIGR03437 family)